MKIDKKQMFVWGLIIVGIGAIVLAMVGAVKQSSQQAVKGNLAEPINSNDWVHGPENAKVTVVEYSDFQCPACGYYYPFVKQLEKDFPDQIRVAYRFFPLKIHQYGLVSAKAAEAAGKQGKFWDMHDLLFEKQQEWSVSTDINSQLVVYAKSVNLDLVKFRADLNSSETEQRINTDIDSGNRSGVLGTPTFFVNGRAIKNPQTYDEFKEIIKKLL